MAYVQQYGADDPQQKKTLSSVMPGNLSTGAGGSYASGGGMGQQQGAPGAPQGATPGSGNFQNLQQFLSLNQGGAQDLATNLGNKIGADAAQAKTDLTKTKDLQIGTGTDKEQADRAAAQMAAQNQAQNVQSQARAVGDQYGRQQSLQQYYGGAAGPYTQGQSAYDSFLLGGTPGAAGTLQGAQNNYGNLAGYLTNNPSKAGPGAYTPDPSEGKAAERADQKGDAPDAYDTPEKNAKKKKAIAYGDPGSKPTNRSTGGGY